MKLNRKMLIIMASVVGAILVIMVIMLLLAGGKSKNLSYAELENKIVSAGQRYFKDKPAELPNAGSLEISTDTLVSNGYMNELSKYTKKGTSCSGKLIVTKIPGDYSYRAVLSCGDSYTTTKFADVLAKGVSDSQNGLYESEQFNPITGNNESVYLFKGNNVKNYVKVGEGYWLIVKAFESGHVMLIRYNKFWVNEWDDRYNSVTKDYTGINIYEKSRIKDTLISEVVENNEAYSKIKKLIVPHNVCTGPRSTDDTTRDGSAECSKILENQYFSLLPVYDFMNAGLDENCIKTTNNACYNYNYLAESGVKWWSSTPVLNSDDEVYYISATAKPEQANASLNIRVVTYLDPYISYVSGTGTFDDPYIVK